MDLHDLGGLVWAIFVVIAVVSSIVRSAKRNIQQSQQLHLQRAEQRPAQFAPQPQPAPAPPAPAPVVAPAPQRVQRFIVRDAPAPPVIPSVAIVQARAASQANPFAVAPPRRKRENLFGPGISVVKGIVALEVLGPPRALRDWTPLV